MRILALVTDAFGASGGIARFNQHFLSALASTNGKTGIVVLARTGRKGMGKLRFVFTALTSVRKGERFDWIFCGHLHLAPLAAWLSKMGRIPFWLQLHGIEAWEKASPGIRWAVREAALVTAVSRHTRRKFLAWSGVSPEKVKILPNTVDERFQPGPKPDYLLRRYGLAGKKVLLTVSRLSATERYKGQDRVIDLLPELLEKHPDLVYVIAGEGDDQLRLQDRVREKGVAGSVRFVGEVKDSELVDTYRMADLFVMPSTAEGFGIVFLEAARSGIPVVGGAGDGSYDALLEGRLGQAVNSDQPEELIQAIEAALTHRRNGSRQAEHFSSANFRRHVIELVKKIMENAEHSN